MCQLLQIQMVIHTQHKNTYNHSNINISKNNLMFKMKTAI